MRICFSLPGSRRLALVSLASLLLAATARVACAIPSPEDHLHVTGVVFWTNPGAPPLSWDNATANAWNHNHLTSDPFVKAAPGGGGMLDWNINKAWDNRTLHNSVGGGPAQFGHGMILPGNEVRYNFANDVPAAAKTVVDNGFAAWQTRASIQFFSHANLAYHHLAIDFQRADSGPVEITVSWDADLNTDGYGVFNGTNNIKFAPNPNITLSAPASVGDVKRISVGNPGNGSPGSLAITQATPWTFTGAPAIDHTDDFWYSDDSGATWASVAPVGFGDLGWNFGTLPATDSIDIYQMDFETIALHEIGHAIALGHTGPGSNNIMDDDIANNAHFGRTLGIDEASALAVAIDYTYATPEPASLAILALGGVILFQRRRR